jgi:uncharacterized protein (TIGR02145 family)
MIVAVVLLILGLCPSERAVAASCCLLRGNVDCDLEGNIDIADVTRLIDYMYISFAPLCCDSAANIDGDPEGIVDIADFTALIDYMYINFTPLPPCAGTVTDIDGNVYQTVTIGTQVWMAENLKVTRYRNGDWLPNAANITEWSGLTTGGYCEYDNDSNNVATYGRLYNWYAATDIRKIAPEGWHVPSDTEWQTLIVYLGDSTVAGAKMKEADTTHWSKPNVGATNESGFTGLPGGFRLNDGTYGNLRYIAYFWSTTGIYGNYAWIRILDYFNGEVRHTYSYDRFGYSIRCVKD